LIAKLHKLVERRGKVGYEKKKDAVDVLRLLLAVPVSEFVTTFKKLLRQRRLASEAWAALRFLQQTFGSSGDRGIGFVREYVGSTGYPEEAAVRASRSAVELLASVAAFGQVQTEQRLELEQRCGSSVTSHGGT
jgi:hypothetical protein